MSPFSVIEIMFVITTMELAIEVMKDGRWTSSHMEADIPAMLKSEMDMEHMEVRNLHGTKEEISL